jgi:hypothetical protein
MKDTTLHASAICHAFKMQRAKADALRLAADVAFFANNKQQSKVRNGLHAADFMLVMFLVAVDLG